MDHKESPQELIKPIIKLFFSGQIQEALDAVEVLIKNYPNESLLFNICGVFYKEIGQPNEAVKRFKKALVINPEYAEAHNNLGVALQNLGLMDAAVKSYENAVAVKPDYTEAHNNLGVALQNLGLMDSAVKSYEKAVALKPDYTEAHNNLGNIFKELKQLDAAIKSYEKVIAINPDYPEAHYNLGNTLRELGQLETAIKSYEKVIAIKPDYADVHFNLGDTLRKLGQLDKAVKCYEKAISIKVDFADAHNNLGVSLKILGQLDEAVKCYEKAISIEVDFADAHNNLGVALQRLGQQDKAIKCYKKAIAIKPDYAEALTNLGIAYRKLGQLDKAVKCYKKVFAIKPDYADAYYNLGIACQQLGQLDKAAKHYEKALTIKPDYAHAYYHLSYLKDYTANDPQITKMKSLLSDSKLPQSDRINLCFALAKVYENLDNQDELFKYLHEANSLNKQELNYSFDKQQKFIEIIKEIFNKNPPNIEHSLSFEPSTFKPIFIVGMPRSGSTLVEQIMSSHHEVHGAGELDDLRKILGAPVSDNLTQGSDIISTSIGDKKINLSNKYDLPEKAFLSIREQYLDVLSNFNVPESVITDKQLLNFRFIGFILTAFPEAKIIHLKRDARATCWSIYKTNFSNDFGNNFEDLAGFYGLYADLMDFWHQLFPGKIYDMCYEDLTTDQEEETRKLLQYCELDWDENCLSFHKNKRAIETASSIQVREKMYQGSSEAWKKHETYLKPLVKALNAY
jgi:tetratricopeptide (TPR) repeat protein